MVSACAGSLEIDISIADIDIRVGNPTPSCENAFGGKGLAHRLARPQVVIASLPRL